MLLALSLIPTALACSNILVTKGASVDGNNHFAYSADAGSLYGTLGHYPAADHPAGSMRDVWDWDSGIFLGKIPEANHTYNVIGNINEHALAIGETTFGGLESLAGQTDALVDYGNLIWIALQRSRTAREAITVMTDLVAAYGYASEGESFSISDRDELWLLEMIGKGKGEKGAVWVAMRIPDGAVASHANQARITTFAVDDPDNCMFAPDVVSFAVEKGLYPSSAPASEFSFSDVYDPVTFTGARLGEARVWSFFSQVSSDPTFEAQYMDYATGHNLTNRMPLWVIPRHKLSVTDTMNHMRNHYENTYLDMRNDVGAGAYNSAFRVRPLVWSHSDDQYVNERPVGAQQTGWHFVAHLRQGLPDPIAGLMWFGVDDFSHAVQTPIYGGATKVPYSYADGTGDALTFDLDSAFWVFNLVANFVYPRYSYVNPVVASAIAEKTQALMDEVAEMDTQATEAYLQDKDKAIALISSWCEITANQLVAEWRQLYFDLFVRFRDGFDITSKGPNAPDHGGKQGGVVPDCGETGYPDAWHGRIAADTGDHQKIPKTLTDHDQTKLALFTRL